MLEKLQVAAVFLESDKEFGIVLEEGIADLQDFKCFLQIKEKELTKEELIGFSLTLLKQYKSLFFMNNICHRDIKPSNIILSFNLSPDFIDFGLASSTLQIIQTLGIAGTYGYIDPNILEKQRDFDRTDLVLADYYSLGITLMDVASPKFKAPKTDAKQVIETELKYF